MERFEIYQKLKEEKGHEALLFYWDELPQEALDKLSCACCGLPLRDCLAMKEGEQTTILAVTDPEREERSLNLLVVDEHGQVGDYYAFCGKGCYEE